MSTKNDGGPAFPVSESIGIAQAKAQLGLAGMSLRDWFAWQQMVRIGGGWPNTENMKQIADNCYAMADAMLKAREK